MAGTSPAMTISISSIPSHQSTAGSRRRQYHATDYFAGAKLVHHRVDILERSRGDGNGRQPGFSYELDQLFHLRQAANIRTLNGECAHRNRRQRYGEIAAVQTDDHIFAALDETVVTYPRALRRADEIDDTPGPAIGHVDDLLRRIGGTAIDHRFRSCFLRGFPLDRIDVDDDRA